MEASKTRKWRKRDLILFPFKLIKNVVNGVDTTINSSIKITKYGVLIFLLYKILNSNLEITTLWNDWKPKTSLLPKENDFFDIRMTKFGKPKKHYIDIPENISQVVGNLLVVKEFLSNISFQKLKEILPKVKFDINLQEELLEKSSTSKLIKELSTKIAQNQKIEVEEILQSALEIAEEFNEFLE